MLVPSAPHQHAIPRAYVHKYALDAVFITSWEPLSDNTSRFHALLPRSHGFYREFLLDPRRADLALLVEICRQGCFVIAHQQFGVPVEGNPYQFLFQHLAAEERGQVPQAQRGPLEIIIDTTIERRWRRKDGVSGLAWHFQITAQEEPLADIRIRMTWVERTLWMTWRNVMRRGRGLPKAVQVLETEPTNLSPADVGRVNPANVVLSRIDPDGDGWRAKALIDVRHPTLFDHSIDHIYAMVQLETCRQIALYTVAWATAIPATELEMIGCRATFETVGEFDLQTELVATLAPPGRVPGPPPRNVDVAVMQGERRLSRFAVAVDRVRHP